MAEVSEGGGTSSPVTDPTGNDGETGGRSGGEKGTERSLPESQEVSLRARLQRDGAGLIFRAMRQLGYTSTSINDVINFYNGFIGSGFADYLFYPFVVLIWFEGRLNSISIELPSWVTDIQGFVIGVVKPQWGRVLTEINAWVSFWNGRVSVIRSVLETLIPDFDDVVSFVRWVYNSIRITLLNIANDPMGWIEAHLPKRVLDFLRWADTRLIELWAWLEDLQDSVYKLVDDPLGWLFSILPDDWQEALKLISANYDRFMQIIDGGRDVLADFMTNPVGYLYALVIDSLLEWFRDALINEW